MALAPVASSSTTISQLSCFSSINRNRLPLQRRSIVLSPSPRSKLWVVGMSVDGRGTPNSSSSDIKTSLSSTPTPTDAAPSVNSDSKNVYGSAKIHDFCLGIPYGGVVLGGGILGSLFSRNLTALASGLFFGGALLALSISSLKIWRQAKSSIPFVLGQAVLSAALLGKNFKAYSLTKRIIPSGFYIAISGAMLCFYLHVMISGGNPPPKKLQSATAVAS